MDYITIDTMRKLQSVGFSYPEYEHALNNGMLFYYNGDEYFVGGYTMDSFSLIDREVAEKGQWLPDASQLLDWLQNTDFSVIISTDADSYFSIQATDLINGQIYSCGGATCANALAKLIFKICKSKKRIYMPRETLRIPIIGQKTGDGSLSCDPADGSDIKRQGGSING